MRTSTFAVVAGFFYLAAGLTGLVPVMLVPPPADAPPTSFALLYGYLFGLFPVNVLHTALHLAVGFWGLCAWSQRCSALAYSRALAAIFGLLAVLGMVPGLDTLFGVMPIHGHDVWLHGVTALVAAYFGWRAPAVSHDRRRTDRDRRRQAIPVASERRFGLADRREDMGTMQAA